MHPQLKPLSLGLRRPQGVVIHVTALITQKILLKTLRKACVTQKRAKSMNNSGMRVEMFERSLSEPLTALPAFVSILANFKPELSNIL